MQVAFVTDDFESMKSLVLDGADVNSVDARDGSTILHRAVISNDLEMIRFLIDHNVEIDKPGPRKLTALHCAALYKFLDAAILLIDAGASVDAKDLNGGTPLAYALSSRKTGFLEMAKLLISHGAQKNVKSDNGISLMDVYGELLKNL